MNIQHMGQTYNTQNEYTTHTTNILHKGQIYNPAAPKICTYFENCVIADIFYPVIKT